MIKPVGGPLEILQQEAGTILITNIEPFLTNDEIICHIKKRVVIDGQEKLTSLAEYVKQAHFANPYSLSMKPGCCYEVILMTEKDRNRRTFNQSISLMQKLGYVEATLMDCLHILSLTDKKFQGYQNKIGQPVSNISPYLLAPGTITNPDIVIWSLMPRLRIKGSYFLDSIPWRNLSNYNDHAVVGIKKIE